MPFDVSKYVEKKPKSGFDISRYVKEPVLPTPDLMGGMPDSFAATPEPATTAQVSPLQFLGAPPEQLTIGAAPEEAMMGKPIRQMTQEERATTSLQAEKYLASGRLEERIAEAKATQSDWDKFQTSFSVGFAKGVSGGYLDPGEYLERTGEPNATGLGYLSGMILPFKGIHMGLRALPVLGKGMAALSRTVPAIGVPAETGATFGVHGGLRKPEEGESRLRNIVKEGALGVAMGLPFGVAGQIAKIPVKPRLKAKPEGAPLEPVLSELLGFEKPKVQPKLAREKAPVRGAPLEPVLEEVLGAVSRKRYEAGIPTLAKKGKTVLDKRTGQWGKVISANPKKNRITVEWQNPDNLGERGRLSFEEFNKNFSKVRPTGKTKIAPEKPSPEPVKPEIVAGAQVGEAMGAIKEPAPKVTKPKEAWEMTKKEFTTEESRGMGEAWNNAAKTDKGKIVISATEDHGNLISRLDNAYEIDAATNKPQYRGWVWGKDKTTFIDISDLNRAKGDFHRAYIEKALSENKPIPTEVLVDYPEMVKKAKPVAETGKEAVGFKKGTVEQTDILGEGKIVKKPSIGKQEGLLDTFDKETVEGTARQRIAKPEEVKRVQTETEPIPQAEGQLEITDMRTYKPTKEDLVFPTETPQEAILQESHFNLQKFATRDLKTMPQDIQASIRENAKIMLAQIGKKQRTDFTAVVDRPTSHIKKALAELAEGKSESKTAKMVLDQIVDDLATGEKAMFWDKMASGGRAARWKTIKKAGGDPTFQKALEEHGVVHKGYFSQRGAVIDPFKAIREPAGAKRVPYKEAIKAPDRPEMTNMETYYKTIMAPEKLRPPIKKAALSKTAKEARELGVALRQTKGGKVVPAVRKAGTYVPEEFAQYKNFKDAKVGIGGGTKDLIRYIQEVDGALSPQKKAKLPGQAGPAEKYVLRRTEDIVKLELDWSAEQTLRIKKIVKGLSRKQDELVTQVLEETSRPGSYVETADFATNARIRRITNDTKVVKAAQESRKALEHWFKQQNNLRKIRGQETINYREYYAPHILREASLWERVFNAKSKPKEIVAGPQLPDYIKPNKPFNPRELAREVGLKDYMREMRISKILEDYANTASRDIHHTSIIQNNKAFIQQLEAMGYKNAAEGISGFTAEGFGGVKPTIDRALNLPIWVAKTMRFWRGSLMRSVFPANFTWNTTVQTLSSANTVMRAGITNSARGMVDWFGNPKLRNRIKTSYSYRVKAQRSGRITQQDINTGVTNMISKKRSAWQAAIDGTNYLTELVERELTGWSIASGLRHGAKRGLKGRALWDYASDTGAKTQSMYNPQNKPGIIRSEFVQTTAPFQTFVFEMYNTAKEFAGKTGTPPGAMTERIGWVLRFTAAAYAGNTIAHAVTGRRPWEIYSFIPFSDQTIKPVVDALRGKPYDAISGRGLPSFVGAGIQFARAVRSYLRYGDTRKLRNWGLKYGTAFMKIPGGTQISRMVDGWIAVADGKMKDSRGKTLFKISDPWEQVRAVSLGPWRTKAGIEYWDERETNIFQDLGIIKKKKKKKRSISGWGYLGAVGGNRSEDTDFAKNMGAVQN